MKRTILAVLLFILVISGLAVIPLGYYLYFKPNNNVFLSFSEERLYLVIEGEQAISGISQSFWKGR